MAKKYEAVNKELWPRKAHFDFFSADAGSPLYDITAYLDVTRFHKYIKHTNLSFYYSLIWVTTHVMNQIVDFRYKIRNNDVILQQRLIPAFADLKNGSDLFHLVVLDFQGDMAAFSHEAERRSKEQQDYFPQALSDYDEDMLIQFSCLPWISFTSLNSEKSGNRDDSVPKITLGKYEKIGENLRLPYSIQVNHRLIDGIHLGKLFTELQKFLDNLPLV